MDKTRLVSVLTVLCSLQFTFTYRNDTARRSFYIARHADVCDSDLGWLAVIEPGSVMCKYDRLMGREYMKPAILFTWRDMRQWYTGKYLLRFGSERFKAF